MTYKALLLSDAPETLEHVTSAWKIELLFDRWRPKNKCVKTELWSICQQASFLRGIFIYDLLQASQEKAGERTGKGWDTFLLFRKYSVFLNHKNELVVPGPLIYTLELFSSHDTFPSGKIKKPQNRRRHSSSGASGTSVRLIKITSGTLRRQTACPPFPFPKAILSLDLFLQNICVV